MVSSCYVHIPALPGAVTVSGSIPVLAQFAYAPTHTNYFGGTSCGLSSVITPTPSSFGQPSPSVKCTLPLSISGKGYAVTPVIWVPRSVSSKIQRTPYDCDPIPAASLNAGNFKFGCTGLPGKSMGSGFHTINWIAPTGGVPIAPFSFWAMPPTTTPTYVVNAALAKTTIVPTTILRVTATTSSTNTLPASTIIVPVATGTSTCTFTVTASAGTAVKRAREHTVVPVNNTPPPGAPVPTTLLTDRAPSRKPAKSDDLPLFEMTIDSHVPSIGADSESVGSNDSHIALKQRAVAPTIGRPDFTYPPFGSSSVYVSSISTSTCTDLRISAFTVTPPVVTRTVLYEAYVLTTVTATPASPR